MKSQKIIKTVNQSLKVEVEVQVKLLPVLPGSSRQPRTEIHFCNSFTISKIKIKMKESKPYDFILDGLFQHRLSVGGMFSLPDDQIQVFSTFFNSFHQRTFGAYKRFSRTKSMQVDSTVLLQRITS